MACLEDTSSLDGMFQDTEPSESLTNNGQTSVPEIKESDDTRGMLLQFAESVERCLIDTHGELYKSKDMGRHTKKFSSHEMLIKENLFEFKTALWSIRKSQDLMTFGSVCSQVSNPTSRGRSPTSPIERIFQENRCSSFASFPTAIRSPNYERRSVKHGDIVTMDPVASPGTDSNPASPFCPTSPSCTATQSYPTSSLIPLDAPGIEDQTDTLSESSEQASRDVCNGKAPVRKQLSDFTFSNLVTPTTAVVSKHADVEHVCFSFQFLIITERLKVTVKNAGNLFKRADNDNESNSFAEVCLIPGKVQVQTTELVRKSSNPHYDSVFYFKGFRLQEMHQMHLRVRLMAKRNILCRPRIIGEVVVALENFDLVSETVLDELLHTRIVSHIRGSVRHVLLK